MKKKKQQTEHLQQQRQPNNVSPRDGLVVDIRSLMELVPYVLPPSLFFSQFVKDTLTFSFRQPVPEYGPELFDHFEIEVSEPIALRRSGTDTSRRSERSEVSRSPVKDGGGAEGGGLMERRQKCQRAYFASLAEEENNEASMSSNNSNTADDESAIITGSLSTATSAQDREKDDAVLFKTSISLTFTAPNKTSNPFLKGSARGNYVGSHLGAKLANITSLFREEKAPPRRQPQLRKTTPPQVAKRKGRNSLSAKLQFEASSSVEARSAAASRASPAVFSIAEETPLRQLIIEETPVRRERPWAVVQYDAGGSIVAETSCWQPQQSSATARDTAVSSVQPINLWQNHSPISHREDLAGVIERLNKANVAKSNASRKKK